MLVLNRKPGQAILIGENVEVVINDLGEHNVKVGINAPQEVSIKRAELLRGDGAPSGAAEPERRRRPNGRGESRPARRARTRRFQPRASAKPRRRVMIEPEAAAESETPAGVGEEMMRDAIREIPPDVLQAVARGDAVDRRIRRALIALAQEELLARERATHRA